MNLYDSGVLEALLRNRGFEMTRDHAAADVIVLDICMPGMDGIETLGQVLSRDNTIPVILHTAYSSYKDNFMTWSADAYVVKSSDLAELKAKLEEVLAKQKS